MKKILIILVLVSTALSTSLMYSETMQPRMRYKKGGKMHGRMWNGKGRSRHLKGKNLNMTLEQQEARLAKIEEKIKTSKGPWAEKLKGRVEMMKKRIEEKKKAGMVKTAEPKKLEEI